MADITKALVKTLCEMIGLEIKENVMKQFLSESNPFEVNPTFFSSVIFLV